jgi:hypothetical protein
MKIRFLLLFLLFVFLSACSSSSPSPTPTETIVILPTLTPTQITPSPTPEPTHTPSPTPTEDPDEVETAVPSGFGPDNFPTNVNPLTGLEISDPSILDRRPIGIKIDISLLITRPPFGMSMADIIYNYYHNGFTSRYHVIFYGEEAEMVGAIRSARLLDDELIRMYKSVFAYGNADEKIRNRLFRGDYTDRLVIEGSPAVCPSLTNAPMCRYGPSGGEILLAGTKELSEFISNRGVENGKQNLDGMYFHPIPPEDGKPVDVVVTQFSIADYTRFEYDRRSGKYLFFQDIVSSNLDEDDYEPLLDRLTEEQIALDNVVVVVARHEFVQRPPNEIIEIYLEGTGKAYAFRDGLAYEVVWNRPKSDSVLYLTFPDGSNYAFKPGNTIIQIISEGSETRQEKNGEWMFRFKYPF